MAAEFFITGLPRSRTAWCANWMTAGNAFCYHDGLANCPSLDAFAKKLAQYPICGDSDSGLLFFYDELRVRYPEAQWAVVRREPEEVVASLLAMPSYPGVPELSEPEVRDLVQDAGERLDRIAADPRNLQIRWQDLSNREAARAFWWHCLRDAVPWNAARWEQLRDMNVSVRNADITISLNAAARLFGEAA